MLYFGKGMVGTIGRGVFHQIFVFPNESKNTIVDGLITLQRYDYFLLIMISQKEMCRTRYNN